jgi:hypothetical protein
VLAEEVEKREAWGGLDMGLGMLNPLEMKLPNPLDLKMPPMRMPNPLDLKMPSFGPARGGWGVRGRGSWRLREGRLFQGEAGGGLSCPCSLPHLPTSTPYSPSRVTALAPPLLATTLSAVIAFLSLTARAALTARPSADMAGMSSASKPRPTSPAADRSSPRATSTAASTPGSTRRLRDDCRQQ